jgi:glycosyltransferase involved in cell wall biosynthesis
LILILFTSSYPYVTGGEQNFLEVEVQHLLGSFERVILVPLKCDGERSPVLPRVEVDDSYADHMRSNNSKNRLLINVFSALVYKEIISKPSILFKFAYLERLLMFTSQAEMTRRWVVDWIRKQNIDPRECLFYTYWFHQAAMGIGLVKNDFPDIKLISRAHGGDLYEDRQTPPYFPCRDFALQAVDFLFPDSDAGTDYLQKKYPQFALRMETARLGILDSGVITKASSDGIYRIVSCSKMVPVKRLHLVIQGIMVAAKRRPSQRFEWCHFGTGPLEPELGMMVKGLPENILVRFAGYSTQPDLFNYYRENPVDIFVNVSESEGTPVAVMEAVSCGIPVIATAVGGNKEIVSKENGYLLPANPTPDEIADTLLHHWDVPGEKRVGSQEMWRNRYNAVQNFSAFVKRLVKIRVGNYID